MTSLPVNVPAPAAPTPNTYTVVRGDTLARIAVAHDVPLAELLRLNEVPNPELIEPGLVLLLEPAPELAPAASAAASTAPVVAPPPPVDEAWYQPIVDRLPPLPEELQPAQPVLIAIAAVLIALMAVGLIAITMQFVYALVGAGASSLAFGGRGLQAAVAGIPRSAGAADEDDDASPRSTRAFGWRPRLNISRLSLPTTRPRFRRSSHTASAVEPQAVPPAPLEADPPPVAAPALPEEGAPPIEAPLPEANAPDAPPPIPAPAASPPPTPLPASPSRVEAPFALPSALPPPHAEDLRGPVPPPPPSAPLAAPERPRAPGRLTRFGNAVASAAAVAARHVRAAAAAAAYAVARWTRIAAIATWHATLRLLRAAGRLAVRGAGRAAVLPGRFLHEHGEQRRRRQFRQRVESSTAARMRLGLREDSETHLQESLDESPLRGLAPRGRLVPPTPRRAAPRPRPRADPRPRDRGGRLTVNLPTANLEAYQIALIVVQIAILSWIVIHDLRTLIVPNRYVYPAILVSLIAIAPLGLAALTSVWLGALAAFAAMLVIALVSRGAMGLGDTKVGAFCGAIVGLQGVASMLTLTFVGGGLVSAGLVLTRIRGRSDAIPFTPFFLLAVLATLLLAGPAA